MKTREDAVQAIQELIVDLTENPSEWENPQLARYLDALAAWIEGHGKKYNEPISWELVIRMLQGAKFYE